MGGETYVVGDTCTVVATANVGYNFVNWTENGEQVSADEAYTFTVTGNRTLVANFTFLQYNITVTSNPTNGGNVSGGGTYYEGEQCTVTAIPVNGYAFTWWYEIYVDEGGGSMVPVSSDATYTFTVTGDRTLRAEFIAQPQAPEGAINGLFTINANGDQVFFSKGNLQYNKESDIWSFAEHQYDTVGGSAWQSLFGWGTGNNPTLNSENNDDYSTFVDWGVNPISNGGNQPGLWHTLSSEELLYLFDERPNANSKYGGGNVDGSRGLIILPDKWTCPPGLTFNPGLSQVNNDWSNNVYTSAQWQQMEDAGAVFLPKIWNWVENSSPGGAGGGYFCLNSVYYWSFSWANDRAIYLFFNGTDLNSQNYDFDEHRNYHLAVRLVCPSE